MTIPYTLNLDGDRATLRLQRALEVDERLAFVEALNELCGLDAPRYFVDLRCLTRVSSLYFGALIDFANQAREKGRAVTVLVNSTFHAACEIFGLDQMVAVVIED